MQLTHSVLLRGLNTPSLLSRISLALSRRRLNVQQFRMQLSEDGRFASYEIILACDRPTAERLQKQLCRIVELLKVSLHTDLEFLESAPMDCDNKEVRAEDLREGHSRKILKAV